VSRIDDFRFFDHANSSPRWYIKKKKYKKAFLELCELRESRAQAARDVFYIYCLTYVEWRVKISMERDRFSELFKVRRNFRALLASSLVLLLQQQCGINVIIYVGCRIQNVVISYRRF